MSDLPVNVANTYPDKDVGDTEHQQHHDLIHAFYNQLRTKVSILSATTASFTAADEAKLDGIAPGATANSPDGTLLSRSNHVGTQAATTVTTNSDARANTAGADVDAVLNDYDIALDGRALAGHTHTDLARGGYGTATDTTNTVLSLNNGAMQRRVAGASILYTLPPIPADGTWLILHSRQDQTGGRVLTFTAAAGETIAWQTSDGLAPAQDTNPLADTVYSFMPDPESGRWLAYPPGAILEEIFGAKGDLLVATSDNNPVRLPVGADGLPLVAWSTSTEGLNYRGQAKLVLNAQTAAYTLAINDGGKAVDVTSASAVAVTIPPNSSVALPVGTVIEIAQLGAGLITITPGAGVTLNWRGGTGAKALAGQYAVCSIRQTAANVWLLAGDLAA